MESTGEVVVGPGDAGLDVFRAASLRGTRGGKDEDQHGPRRPDPDYRRLEPGRHYDAIKLSQTRGRGHQRLAKEPCARAVSKSVQRHQTSLQVSAVERSRGNEFVFQSG